jgi:hypothetical protein
MFRQLKRRFTLLEKCSLVFPSRLFPISFKERFFESARRLLNQYLSKARPKLYNLGSHEDLPQIKLCKTRTSVQR